MNVCAMCVLDACVPIFFFFLFSILFYHYCYDFRFVIARYRCHSAQHILSFQHPAIAHCAILLPPYQLFIYLFFLFSLFHIADFGAFFLLSLSFPLALNFRSPIWFYFSFLTGERNTQSYCSVYSLQISMDTTQRTSDCGGEKTQLRLF